jgi:hypothetical protein
MDHLLLGIFKPKERNKDEEFMLQERLQLAKVLERSGIEYALVNSKWVRDDFVNHNGKLYFRNDYGFYADGGYILNNPKFTSACSDVSKVEGENIHEPEKRFKILQQLYGDNVFVLPPPDQR